LIALRKGYWNDPDNIVQIKVELMSDNYDIPQKITETISIEYFFINYNSYLFLA
jgi:hypothetical protein